MPLDFTPESLPNGFTQLPFFIDITAMASRALPFVRSVWESFIANSGMNQGDYTIP